MKLTHLSLFSGIGGIDLAAEWAGFETVAFVERDPFCQKVLAKHWPEVPIYDDVTTFDGTRFRGVDLLSGGPPCQPVSVAGRRRGVDDERWLWDEYVRIVREASPRWIVAENPTGLISDDGGRTFARVVDGLAEVGYRLGWGVWRAYDVGACHLRARVFIVGHLADGPTRQDHIGEPGDMAEAARCRKGCHDATRACCEDAPDAERLRLEGYMEPQRGDSAPDEGRVQVSVGSLSDSRYAPLQSRDWRSWGIEPVVRGGDDGLTRGVDSANRIKALGNAVVPQQVYPILKAIAETFEAAA